jgi:PAS domain S-box-containing protein
MTWHGLDRGRADANGATGQAMDSLLRIKLVVALLAALLVVVPGATGYKRLADLRAYAAEEVLDTDDRIASALEHRLEQSLYSGDALLLGVSAILRVRPELISEHRTDLRGLLVMLAAEAPGDLALGIIYANGNFIGNTAHHPSALLERLADAIKLTAFSQPQRASLDRLAISFDPSQAASGTPILSLWRRVVSADGTLLAIVCASFTTTELHWAFSELIPKDHNVTADLYHANGTLIFRTVLRGNSTPDVRDRDADLPIQPGMLSQHVRQHIAEPNAGTDRFLTIRPIANLPLALVVRDDGSGPFEETNGHQRLYFAVLAVIALMVTGATAYILALLGRQHRLATEVRSARQRYNDALDASSDWFWETGPNMRFTELQYSRDGGPSLDPKRILGRTRAEIADPTYDPKGWQRHVEDLAARRPFRDFVFRSVTVQGQERYVSASGKPIFDETGTFLGYRGCGRVVTEQVLQKAELDRLVQRNELLVTAINHATNGMLITDPRQPDNPIVFVNPAFTRITGYAEADAIGRNPRFLRSLETDPQNVAALRAAVENRKPAKVVLLDKRKDGTPFWNELSISPVFDGNGALTAFIGIQNDVTERIQVEKQRDHAESQFRHSQKLEALGTLAGGIAHDFNNSLASIVLMTQFCIKSGSSEKKLTTILAAAQHAKSLVSKILAFSRREEVVFEEVDLRQCFQESVELCRLGTPALVSVDALVDGEGPFAMHGDRTQIVQVFTNILANAIHAVGEKGRVAVTLREVDVAYVRNCGFRADAERYACITIEDGGVGMTEEVKSRIFEPFFTTKPVGQGTGLGLAVVHGIVANHHGHIYVESAPGVGTTFTVFLQLANSPQTTEDSRALVNA